MSGFVKTPQVGAGPKKRADDSPLDISMLPPARDWRRVKAFIEYFLLIPETAEPFKLKPFQVDILKGLFPARGEKPRMGLISLARGQGKSYLASAICVYGLFADVQAPEVLAVASTLEQAQKIIFRTATLFIYSNPELANRCKLTRYAVETPFNAGALYALPSTEGALQGWRHSLAVIDELHVTEDAVWESVVSASLKREGSLTLAISTPPRDPNAVMQALAREAKANPDPQFFYREFTSDNSHDALCECCIKTSRPLTYNRKGELKGLASLSKKMPEAQFRRLMLAQWDVPDDRDWIAAEAWDALADSKLIDSQERVILGFDGSWSGDYTALVAISLTDKPHVMPVAVWKPSEGSRVPVAEVEQTIRDACNRWDVVEVVCDPYRWQRSIEILAGDGLPMVEFPQTATRLSPATVSLYTAIQNKAISHNGDTELRNHFLNARVKETNEGIRITKAGDKSPLKIDLAMATVMAYSRVVHHLNKKVEPNPTGVYSW